MQAEDFNSNFLLFEFSRLCSETWSAKLTNQWSTNGDILYMRLLHSDPSKNQLILHWLTHCCLEATDCTYYCLFAINSNSLWIFERFMITVMK